MKFIKIGALLSALSVILGAFGAHGIKGKISNDLFEVYQTSNHYFTIHTIAIILYGLFCVATRRERKIWPGYLFMLGILLFSGSLYLIVFTEVRAFGMITPFGGLSFILAWIGFGLHAKRT